MYSQKTPSLFNYMYSLINGLKQNGRIRTAETYTATLHSFTRFRNGKDIGLHHLTTEVLEAYQAWMRSQGLVPNTISFYNRILRAVYNRAAEQYDIDNRRPFRHVYTGIDKTTKRALPLSAIKKLKQLDLSYEPALDFARDMFLLSFYLRGMSFIDMAFLTKKALYNGYITYRRRKTGQMLSIKWSAEMQRIIDKYPANQTQYLFPIIRSSTANERKAYLNASYNINHNLKRIAGKINLYIPLTLYCARHSWATAAQTKGIPISTISQGMGHDSESTTRIYLASLNSAAVDRANAIILASI